MRFATLALVLLGLVAGCSGETPGNASPASSGKTGQPGPGKSLPYAGAPEVPDPLPASVMDRDPCTVLTPEQIDELFADPPTGEPKDTGIANTCRWTDTRRGSAVNIQLLYAARHGLSQFYATKDSGELWLPLEPVQGYPVAAYGGVDSRETIGSCGVVVGIANNMVFEADANLPDANLGKDDPCDAARQVADLAVTTLKQGA
jgi:hypothetical protein